MTMEQNRTVIVKMLFILKSIKFVVFVIKTLILNFQYDYHRL